MGNVSIDDIIDYTTSRFEGVVENTNWGERGLFYNPENKLSKGIYILTFKEKDGPNDRASNVNRADVYRLNLGISKNTFRQIFGEIPRRPLAGQVADTGHNFSELDRIMPHPVYGWMSWIAVLNPSDKTFEQLEPLISEGVELAKVKYSKKVKQ